MSDHAASPLRVGQVLNTSLQVAAGGFVLYFVMALIANVPNLIVELVAPSPPPPWVSGETPPEIQPETVPLQGPAQLGLLALVIVGILVSFAMSASATYAMVARLRGTPFDLPQILAGGLRVLLPLLGVLVVMFAVFLGIMLVAGLVWAVIAYGIAGDPKSPLGVLALPIFLVPMLVVSVRLTPVVPVLVVERAGVIATLQRSAALTEGSFWKIFGVFVIAIVFLTAFFAALMAIPLAFLGPEAYASRTFVIVNSLLSSAAIVYFWALTAVIYYELRMAQETGAPPA
jgi:hypothetical protein